MFDKLGENNYNKSDNEIFTYIHMKYCQICKEKYEFPIGCMYKQQFISKERRRKRIVNELERVWPH